MLKRLFFAVLLSLGVQAVSAKPVLLDGMAAIVGSKVIMQQEVLALQSEVGHQAKGGPALSYHDALERLINVELQEVMAQKMGIEVPNSALQQTLQNLAGAQHVSLKEYRAQVEQSGMPWSQYQSRIKQKLRLMLLQKRIVSMEEDVSSSYAAWLKKHQDELTGLQVDYWMFPVDAPEGDKAWRQAKNTAGNWAKTLRMKDKEALPPSVATLHHEPMKALNQLPDLWVQAWRKNPKADIIGPIEVGNGFHLLQIKAVSKPEHRGNAGYEQFMGERVAVHLPTWLDRAKKEVYIKRFAPLVS